MTPTDHPHRPWPAPTTPFAISMRWHDLLFMHYPLPADELRPLLPRGVELDTLAGVAWLGIVPFRMSGIRPRGLPAMPWLSGFPELNVRTYVTVGGRPGVWFFSLDAANPVAVQVARRTYHLNYCDAQMRCADEGRDGAIRFESRRTHRGLPRAELSATYEPVGPEFRAMPGSLEHFLTERYCLYSASRDGRVFRGEIAHAPWPLRPAAARVRRNTMAAQLGIALPDGRPLLHYAGRMDVTAWRPVPVVPVEASRSRTACPRRPIIAATAAMLLR